MPRLDRGDDDAFGVRSELSEIIDIDRRDDCAAAEFGDGHEESINRVFRAAPGRAQQPARTHAGSRVHRVNENALASKLAEHRSIRGPAASDFGEHGRDGRDRKLAPPHLVEC